MEAVIQSVSKARGVAVRLNITSAFVGFRLSKESLSNTFLAFVLLRMSCIIFLMCVDLSTYLSVCGFIDPIICLLLSLSLDTHTKLSKKNNNKKHFFR